MSNEELILLIQQDPGNKELITELWNQVYKFIRYRQKARAKKLSSVFNGYEEDIINESYFYFLEAVKTYDQEKSCKFTVHLDWYLKSAIQPATAGGRHKQAWKKPLNSINTQSIDKIMYGQEEEITLANMLEDEAALMAFETEEKIQFNKDINKKLRQSITDVTTDKTREMLIYMLDTGATAGNAAAHFSINGKRDNKNFREIKKGLEELRRHLNRPSIRKEYLIMGLDLTCYIPSSGYSIKKFKERGSLVEEVALKNIEREEALLYKLKLIKQPKYSELKKKYKPTRKAL